MHQLRGECCLRYSHECVTFKSQTCVVKQQQPWNQNHAGGRTMPMDAHKSDDLPLTADGVDTSAEAFTEQMDVS